MDIVIKELAEKPLSGSDIYNACEKNIKIMRYPELNKFQTIAEAFKPYSAIALLYLTKPTFGHWVLLLNHPEKKTIEYFDSYGGFIDDPFLKIPKEVQKLTNQQNDKLSRLLAESGQKIIYNPVQIQEFKPGVSTCGRHLCLRYLLRHIPLTKYIKVLEASKHNGTDDIITYLTAFI